MIDRRAVASTARSRQSARLWRVASLFVLASTASHAQQAGDSELGKRLFLTGTTPPCAICHSLKDAGAEGLIGPSLDELRPDAPRVVQAMRNGIGQMPAFTTLTDQQLEAIARYVAAATGGAR